MTELDTMLRAKMYIDKMANGINPLNGERVGDDDLINNVRISRCLFYVSGMLDKTIASAEKAYAKAQPKADFTINLALLENFAYSDSPICLSTFVNGINQLANVRDMKKLTYNSLAAWLVLNNVLEDYIVDGKVRKRPSEYGNTLGVSVIERTSQGGKPYLAIVYDKCAQEFIIKNFDKFLKNEKI